MVYLHTLFRVLKALNISAKKSQPVVGNQSHKFNSMNDQDKENISPGDSIPSSNRSGLNSESLNTSVTAEDSNILEKFLDWDFPKDGGQDRGVNSNDQEKENSFPGTQHPKVKSRDRSLPGTPDSSQKSNNQDQSICQAQSKPLLLQDVTETSQDQDKENISPGNDQHKNSLVYGKPISRLSILFLHSLKIEPE